MSSSARIFAGLVIAAVLAVAGYLLISGGGEDVPPPIEPTVVAEPASTPISTLQEQLSERLKGTTLSGSDEVVRALAETLSENPKIVVWLANEDLVRRFVASVNNVAEGKSPRAHLEFLKPKGSFKVKQRGEAFTVDPRSYARYDLATEVFVSLDNRHLAELFAELEPLIDEAHREIAPPNSSFRATLKRAVDHLLATPMIDEDAVLERKVVTYIYADPSIEGLSDVQRQLLRMGPDNLEKIRVKLEELGRALGL